MNCSNCQAKVEANYKFCLRCGQSTDSNKKINPNLASFFNWLAKPYVKYLLPFLFVGLIMLLSASRVPFAIIIVFALLAGIRLVREFAIKDTKPTKIIKSAEAKLETQIVQDKPAVNPKIRSPRAQKNLRAGLILLACGLVSALIIPLLIPKSGNAGADSFGQVVAILFGLFLIIVGIFNLLIGGAQSAVKQIKDKGDSK